MTPKKMIAWLLAGNNGGARSSLADGAPIYLPLLTSAVPTRGSLTPTFTRATTETGQKWDDNGYLDFTALAGEIVFKGARRERNLIATTSENISNAAWHKTGSASASDAVTCVFGAGASYLFNTMTSKGGGNVYISQFKIKGTLGKKVNVMFTDTLTNLKGSGLQVILTTVDTVYSFVTTSSAAVESYDIVFQSDATTVSGLASADRNQTFTVTNFQVNDITGETDQTTIRPYVSVGALIHNSQDPNYLSLPGTAGHYASTPDSVANSITGDIDIRVQAALTDWTPAVTTSLVSKDAATGAAGSRAYSLYIEATTGKIILQASVDGATTADRKSTVGTGITDGAVGHVRATRVASTGACNFYTSTDGTTWTLLGDADVASTSGAIFDSAAPVWCGTIQNGSFPLSGKIYSAQIYNTIGGTTPVVDFNPNRDATTPTGTITSSTTGEVWTLNGASSVVRNSGFHGSMVDGVKCYDTDRLGNAIATTGSYPLVGYVPWEARTNLVWPSEDLTSVRYVSAGGGVAVVADQAVAPDGTTTADQLTASGANGTLIQDLGVIASTAQCFSLYLKRKTGTGNIDITLDGGATWTTQTINSTTWTRCEKTQTLANPDVGIRIVTSGDAVYAWGLQCE